jgi:hypothetical protein
LVIRKDQPPQLGVKDSRRAVRLEHIGRLTETAQFWTVQRLFVTAVQRLEQKVTIRGKTCHLPDSHSRRPHRGRRRSAIGSPRPPQIGKIPYLYKTGVEVGTNRPLLSGLRKCLGQANIPSARPTLLLQVEAGGPEASHTLGMLDIWTPKAGTRQNAHRRSAGARNHQTHLPHPCPAPPAPINRPPHPGKVDSVDRGRRNHPPCPRSGGPLGIANKPGRCSKFQIAGNPHDRGNRGLGVGVGVRLGGPRRRGPSPPCQHPIVFFGACGINHTGFLRTLTCGSRTVD